VYEVGHRVNGLVNDLVQWAPGLIDGIKFTLWLTFGGTVLGIVLAVPLALIRATHAPAWLTIPATIWVELFRGTPLLLQLFYVYFVLPEVGVRLSPATAAIIALGFNYSAYLSEVLRAGIQAVPRSQWEAAETLGISTLQTWRRIILPQASRISLPAVGNYIIAMFKDTALAATISVTDLLYSGQIIAQETFEYVQVYTVVFILYFAMSYPASLGVRYLERRLNVSV
jgi:polar amino acid transport system permease protein